MQGIAGARSAGEGGGASAVFPFQDTVSEYSVKCSVHNMHSVQNVYVKAQLYAEVSGYIYCKLQFLTALVVQVSLRESIAHSFLEDQFTNLTASSSGEYMLALFVR